MSARDCAIAFGYPFTPAGLTSEPELRRGRFGLGAPISRSDHEIEIFNDPGGHVVIAAELDVLRARGAHGAPAAEPGELQPVEPDRSRRLLAAEVVDRLSAAVDADADAAGHRAGQLEQDARTLGRFGELAHDVPHRG